MKQLVFIGLVFCTLNCSESKSDIELDDREIKKYLELVKNPNISRSQRLIYNEAAFEKLAKKNSSLNYKKTIFEIAQNFLDNSDLKGFYKASVKLQEIAINSSDSLYLGLSYQNLGRYYDDLMVSDSSYIYLFKSNKLFAAINSRRNAVVTYLDIANLQYKVSDYSNAEKLIFTALRNLKSLEHSENLKYLSYNLLGIIYCETGDFEKSIEYHNKAYKITQTFKNLDLGFLGEQGSLNNLGNVYRYQKNYAKSVIYYKKALEIAEIKDRDPKLYSSIIDNFAYSQYKLSGNKKALSQFNDALKIRMAFNYIPEIIVSKLHLSEYFLNQGDSLKALNLANSTYRLAKQNHLPAEMLMSLKQSLNCKTSRSNIETYIRINDSIQLAERRMRNKFARIAYETDEIIVEKDTAIKHKWIILGVAGSVLVLVVLLFIIRLQQAKQLELLLKQQQQEANENIYQLIHDQQFQIDAARRDEKKRISQELHDGVMNQLTSTRLNLFVLNKRKDEETIEKCLSLINGIQNIEREIRQVAHDLNSDVFSATNSFNSLLECLFQEQKLIASAIIHTQIDQEIEWEAMDSATKMNLYRIIQEALSNCHKYAQATNIFVTIDKPEDTIHIVINDDGIGFDMKKQIKGIGLRNMSERIKTIGGTIDILSEKGKGTTIIVNLAPNNQLPTTHGKKNQYYNC